MQDRVMTLTCVHSPHGVACMDFRRRKYLDAIFYSVILLKSEYLLPKFLPTASYFKTNAEEDPTSTPLYLIPVSAASQRTTTDLCHAPNRN